VPLRDDLIEKTSQQLSGVLKSLELQDNPDTDQARTMLQAAYQQFTGTDGTLLRQLSSTDILRTLSVSGKPDPERGYVIAILFEVEARLEQLSGRVSSDLEIKALDLYLEAALGNIGAEDIQERLETTKRKLEAFVLPEISEWRLFHYEVKREHFARAETKLFELLGQLGSTEKVKAEGKAFYQMLLQMSDDALELGNLPRDEVEEGYATFKQRLDPTAT
jgi:Family of unknown function (DUF6483)